MDVGELSVEETLDILRTVVPRYSGFHRVEYTPNAFEAAARLTDRYISDRFLPDKVSELWLSSLLLCVCVRVCACV